MTADGLCNHQTDRHILPTRGLSTPSGKNVALRVSLRGLEKNEPFSRLHLHGRVPRQCTFFLVVELVLDGKPPQRQLMHGARVAADSCVSDWMSVHASFVSFFEWSRQTKKKKKRKTNVRTSETNRNKPPPARNSLIHSTAVDASWCTLTRICRVSLHRPRNMLLPAFSCSTQLASRPTCFL